MRTFAIQINELNIKNYQTLRNTTAWPKLSDQQVEHALGNDLFSVAVFDKNRIIGMGRVIGDGAIYYYVQDVIVHPDFQKKGVGALVMDSIENYFTKRVHNYAFIGLMAAEGSMEFYKKLGYKVRSDAASGMYKVIEK